MDVSPFLIWAIKAGLLFALIFLIVRNLRQAWRDIQSCDWPIARARALLSKVVEAPVGVRRGFLGSHAWQVKWEYEVDGKTHTSPVNHPYPPTSEANALMMSQRVSKSEIFNVRYDPENPAISKLSPNKTLAWTQFGFRVGAYALLLGIAIWAITM